MSFRNLNGLFRIFVVSICILAFGCATTRNFESLPIQSADFELSFEKLTEKYPEIPMYEKKFRGFSPNTPLAEDLIKVWGNPDAEKTYWPYFSIMGGTLIVAGALFGVAPAVAAGGVALFIRPVPPKTYIWQKGKYCVEANIDTSFPDYKKRIASWKWTDLKFSENISEDCKKLQERKKEKE